MGHMEATVGTIVFRIKFFFRGETVKDTTTSQTLRQYVTNDKNGGAEIEGM